MKEFNITGTCVPGRHYMADISGKIKQIAALVDQGRYFTINRGRQYGKTTIFSRLAAVSKDNYVVLRLSFEGVDDGNFDSNADFVRMFVRLVSIELKRGNVAEDILSRWKNTSLGLGDADKGKAFDCLGCGISELCQSLDRPVLLMIDEVDKSADNRVFLNFLGMLRNKYLDALDERDVTFYSVILAGVYDIKNMKLKIRPDAERKYNSPWNIAVDFNVDLAFSPEEIATMLRSYEEDAQTGMEIERISGTLFFYTGGYPYLVSWLCKWMDEKGGLFTEEGIRAAVQELLKVKNTLFDDMFKKMEDHPEFADLLRDILLCGREHTFVRDNPAIDIGATFGILSEKNGKAAVSNVIFETRLYNYFLSIRTQEKKGFSVEKSQFITDDGHLDMERVLCKFKELMYAEYRKEDEKFYERQGGLLFLCFLKPIINGTGNYYVEPQTRMGGRMDIVVFYGQQEYIVELKIWHGGQYRRKGLLQLGTYLDSRKGAKGYLVSFNFNRKKEGMAGKVKIPAAENGREHLIYEVVI